MVRRNVPVASASAGLSVRPGGDLPATPYARSVLDAVDRIPRGKVLTYGDVAELMGTGTGRTVGTVMSKHGHEVPWWRVVNATGKPHADAGDRLAAEGCPVRDGRVVLAEARWDGRSPARPARRRTSSGGLRPGRPAPDGA